MAKQTVLVLTNSNDGDHSGVVITKLQDQGEKVFRLDVDSLARGETVVNFSSDTQDFQFNMSNRGVTVSSSEVKSVWYRRPNTFRFPIQDPIQKQFAEDELTSFLEGLWLSLTSCFWVSKPGSLMLARHKILQLKIARELGFSIPRTIVTNNPTTALEFLSACDGQVVFKALRQEFLDYGEVKYNVPTTLITPDRASNLELVRRLPTLFQEFIPKAYELRVTVVGDRIFPVKIGPKVPGVAMPTDWRHPQAVGDIAYEVVSLPPELHDRCLYMIKRLELQFSAFDFVVDPDGNHYFLEVNPNGQWYWLEEKLGIGISDAISDILSIGPLTATEGR